MPRDISCVRPSQEQKRALCVIKTVDRFAGITHIQAFVVRKNGPFSVQDHFSRTSGGLLMWLRSFSSRASPR